MSADDAHRARLIRSLEASREIDATDVRVAARRGVVTLTGEVGSAAERLAVRSIVLGDPDTTDVVDDLEVTPLPGEWRLNDEQITTLVVERMKAHPELAGVTPSCDFHMVRLTGVVAAPEHRRIAHHLARTTRGVHFVIDRIDTR